MKNKVKFNGCFIHESSYVDEFVIIGKGTRIWYFVHISENAVIGENCNIGQNVYIDKGVKIGNNVKIQNNVSIYSGVQIEEDVFLGPSCVFTNVINPRSFIERKTEFKNTIIKKGSTVGANATIVCGNTIGEYAFIGAGAVIVKDVPDYSIVVGNPSKTIGYICECGSRLIKGSDCRDYNCKICGKNYIKNLEENIISKITK